MGYHPRVFERTELPAGPRVISARMPGARSVSIAAYVLAGSRLETDGETGVAHFMEHITFKGTTAYPSTRAISEAIEGVGGSFNAATDRESTVYWVRVPLREATRAMDVIGELIVRPVLSDHDIDTERTIIIEEIRSYLDDPAEYGQILFQGAMFGDGPLGREICGDEAGIRALPSATIRDFWQTTYRPANTVIAIAGDLAHDELVDLASGAFGTGNGPIPTFAPAPTLPAGPRTRLGKRQTSQAQLVIGVPALRRDHPDAWTLAVLNAVLGDGMSSRLFLSVREARGLAYDVSSGLVDYADAGALEISAGVDPTQLAPALEAILAELVRLRDEVVPEAELEKAKRYLAGGMELRMDDTRHVASWIGGQEALHDRVLDLDEALAAVDAVDAESIQRLAEELFLDERLRLSAVAPARHLRGLETRLRLPA
jgi:predicted Zn-dependent peptidase